MSCGSKAAKAAVTTTTNFMNLGVPRALQPKYGGQNTEEWWNTTGGGQNIDTYDIDVTSAAPVWDQVKDWVPDTPEKDALADQIGPVISDTSATPDDPNPSNWMNSSMLAGGSKRRKDKNKKMGMQSTILTGGSGIYSNTA